MFADDLAALDNPRTARRSEVTVPFVGDIYESICGWGVPSSGRRRTWRLSATPCRATREACGGDQRDGHGCRR